MGYTRKHFLNRVREVNEVYLEHARKGMFNEYIYVTFILPRFHISRSTFYEYLAIPYASELKKIEQQEAEKKKREPTLFEDEETERDRRTDSVDCGELPYDTQQ